MTSNFGPNSSNERVGVCVAGGETLTRLDCKAVVGAVVLAAHPREALPPGALWRRAGALVRGWLYARGRVCVGNHSPPKKNTEQCPSTEG